MPPMRGHPRLDEAVEVGAGGVLLDGLIDIEGQSESVTAVLCGDARRVAGADAFQKRFDLKAQGFAGAHGGLGYAEAGEGGGWSLWKGIVPWESTRQPR